MSNSNPFFSIVTIVYNDVNNIEATINSVLKQTYKNYEYIVIDGGSTDGTVDVIKKYQDKISTWVSEPDGGIYPAMNKGISLSKGQVLNFMNCDDYYYNEFVLQKVADAFAEKSDSEFVLGLGSFIDENGIAVKRRGELQTTSLYANRVESVCHQAFFYEKFLHDKFGLYDIEYKIAADALFIYRIYFSKEVKGSFIDDVFAIRRQVGASNSPEVVLETKRVFDEIFGKSLLNKLFVVKYFLKKTWIGRVLYRIYLFIKINLLRR